VQTFDLTDVPSGDKFGHTRFAEAPSVVKAIGVRLATGQPLTDAQLGVGDRLGLATAGAVSTLGHAAGAAVAAPFAIVDPVTRENLSDHLDAAGGQAESAIESGTGYAPRP
jgi:esterase/lipase superfamily enzyme